ncbi:MAG: AAA family ATPase [Myxococcota bacterium]
MYVKSVEISNVRAIDSFRWEIKHDRYAGWHVLIGDNGSGKSSVLRSMALAFVGPAEAAALRQNWADWLRNDERRGHIAIEIDPDDKLDKFAGRGSRVKRYYLPCGLRFTRKQSKSVSLWKPKYKFDPDRHIWSGKPGWFSASYGPFRRFAGGDKDAEKLFYSNPRLARHLSIFGEGIALSECISWLKKLQFKMLEARQHGASDDHPDVALVKHIREFVDQSDFLPHRARIEEISSSAVRFVDGNGCNVSVDELSDGYRSILSMTFELIRQLVETYGVRMVFDREDPTKIAVPGVVLIDEIDAHLHPSWQRRIGAWLCEHFPRVQFIVTTHSPLVCYPGQNSTIYRLPKPGTDSEGGMLKDVARDRLLYGNVLDAYSTGEFGENITRSSSSGPSTRSRRSA